ncbi:steroidogenic acute regulatory protein, mitochondrial isoform X2 [Brachyhypopomus gauderio]|uniref:steroidogenic acute regulatory protein, mitochondrial isoform X2 n=1 Tax=Brachyhypopomus gauderio TaxID=698409 RepID=UPI0040428FFB
MLSAVTKLCCGISYPHFRSVAGLQRIAMAALGQEVTRMQVGPMPLPSWARSVRWSWGNNRRETEGVQQGRANVDTDLSYQKQGRVSVDTDLSYQEQGRVSVYTGLSYQEQGRKALWKALEIVHSPDGWKKESCEDSGDIIYSKVLQGNCKVFRLEAELEAEPDELYDVLFVKVEEMHQWNPSIKHIKVLKHMGKETMVTHEVSAERAGNLIGQRDFLSVRHSFKTEACIYLGGAATHLEAFPPQPGFVRAEDGPTCIIIQPLPGTPGKSRFIWLLNMDVKGWLPKALVNQALARAQADFMGHLRRQLQKKGAGGTTC